MRIVWVRITKRGVRALCHRYSPLGICHSSDGHVRVDFTFHMLFLFTAVVVLVKREWTQRNTFSELCKTLWIQGCIDHLAFPHLITLTKLATGIRYGVHLFISYSIPWVFIAGILYMKQRWSRIAGGVSICIHDQGEIHASLPIMLCSHLSLFVSISDGRYSHNVSSPSSPGPKMPQH